MASSRSRVSRRRRRRGCSGRSRRDERLIGVAFRRATLRERRRHGRQTAIETVRSSHLMKKPNRRCARLASLPREVFSGGNSPQSSHIKWRTLPNSLAFEVTSVAPRRRAWPASNRSYAPIGFPADSSSVRKRAATPLRQAARSRQQNDRHSEPVTWHWPLRCVGRSKQRHGL
jgi:hypothetical protein